MWSGLNVERWTLDVDYWEDLEKATLRRPWDNTMDKTRLEWRRHLDRPEISARVVMRWVRVEFEKWMNSKLQPDLQ